MVEGPLFYSVHVLAEEQYEDMFEAAEVIAERVRAIGQLAPWSLEWLSEQSVITSPKQAPTAGEMIQEFAADHERVAHRLHALMELSGKPDPVTEDLGVARAAFHEKAAWMLRALGRE
ncbi:MAG: DNA starvation/stationary phase protection protein [Pseudomonadota bacterium]